MPDLLENAYTIVESTAHSLAVDILTSPSANIGTLFVSSGEGTYFVEALADTNRNEYGIVDFESLVGLEGVGIANVVANREEVVGWGEEKKLKSYITYDDGTSQAISLMQPRLGNLSPHRQDASMAQIGLAMWATH